MTQAPPDRWTTRTLLAWMAGAFESKGLDSPRRLAEELVAHVLGCERLGLYTDADRPATPIERSTLRDLVKRALAHEPVQYLVGHESFYGLKIKVDRRVLIPRPSTQTLVDAVLQHAKADPRQSPVRGADRGSGMLIADLCTGSGCVAVALAKRLPGARLIATDLCEDALALARENAQHHGVAERIEFLAGDLLAALDAHPVARNAGSLAVLCANPPYIPDDEVPTLSPDIKNFEPHAALCGGADGLALVRRLVKAAPGFLAPGGVLALEIGAGQAERVAKGLGAYGFVEVQRERDYGGIERVVSGRWPG